jgi:16S rRNA (cytidine1402-2'-O)-methyltransferase
VAETVQPRTLYVVPTPIGNLEDITHRAVRILSSVDLIAAEDTRTTKILLDHYAITKPMLSYFSHNEVTRTRELIGKLDSGSSVALVTDAGTPGISDPAFVLIREALQSNISVIPLPGPTAFVPALVASGLPCDRFVFEGFLPLKKGRKTKIEQLKSEGRTTVFYESPHRLLKTLAEFRDAFGDRQAVVAREITKKFEEFRRGTFQELHDHFSRQEPRGEFVILVSGAAKPRSSSPGD